MTDTRTAVYRLYDVSDVLLYVGCSAKPIRRWSEHAKDKDWWPEVSQKTTTWYPTERAALEAERDAIRSERPRFNRAHKTMPPELHAVGAKLGAAHAAAKRERQACAEAARDFCRRAVADGATEVELAELLGADRLTVRRWLGK